MGHSSLLGLCLAVFSISSLTYAQQNVDVVRNPTTSYYEVGPRTINTPPGFSSASRDITPYVSKLPSGGLSQGMPSDVIIDATKQRAPYTSNLKAGSAAVKGAAIRCIQSFRCNAATLVGSVGLELLFSQMNWGFDDNGNPSSIVDNGWDIYPGIPPNSVTSRGANYQVNAFYQESCRPYDFDPSFICVASSPGPYDNYYCPLNWAGHSLTGFVNSTKLCYYGGDGYAEQNIDKIPLTPQQITSGVNDNYVPEPSDWTTIAPDLDLSSPDVTIEVGPIPSITTPPITKTTSDSSGNPVSVETTETRYDISVRPGTNDSKKPVLDVEETTTTTTYNPDNETVSSSTTSSSLLGGAPVPTSVDFDIPTDCAFMPTVCSFIDWVKDMSTEPEPDLSVLLTDQDYEQTYTISFGSETCPEPIDINISFIDKTVQLSYEPACDFVGYARPFVLISAYIFAIYIGLGVVRRG